MKFHSLDQNTLYTASADGTIKITDLDTELVKQRVVDLNPRGFVCEKEWNMFYSLERLEGCVIAGDCWGSLHRFDDRAHEYMGEPLQCHKKGKKLGHLHVHPLASHLFLSSGNDWCTKLWDFRMMTAPLATVPHPRLVSSAFFSPRTGNRILTTCLDNRIRVWDTLFSFCNEAPREIVHSQDFNRYLTPFRAVWDPKDPFERTVMCGRYISDEFGDRALHPIDVFDCVTGGLIACLVDPVCPRICPVNTFHPSMDLIATGSSRCIDIWAPLGQADEDGVVAAGG
eukprot:CAMPEP_0177688920 /NCGR_PEP_ID=MMETSP0447-20121125/34900_1 /TAXON_ID=0 /ORGANISM="Stygamoeba regulata, Strain BSH-02190019" /LENGTH=283 /DNA_ID=CAMNT_0019199223 /DNA_START=368 /DNA_END=1215 /DNA_ORIENTATION=-